MDAFLQYITSQLCYTWFTYMWLRQTGLMVLMLTVRQQCLAEGRSPQTAYEDWECPPPRDVTDRLTPATARTSFVGEISVAGTTLASVVFSSL